MADIIEKLKELGFNSSEAKVYVALLKKYPATGYEISQSADIPQPRAYDALKSLEAESIVYSNTEKPQKYIPITPKELTQRYKRKYNSTLDFLEKKLPQIKGNYNEPIHNISDYEQILEKAKEIIKNSKQSIYLEIWNTDFKQIEQSIIEAYNNDVEIKIIGYDNLNTIYGLLYKHEGGKEAEKLAGGRFIYLISDNSEALLGKIEENVIWTKNNVILNAIKERIVNNMYLLDINTNFPEQLKYFYGVGFKKLKEKILGK